MISVFKRALGTWRGSGLYSVTVPPMDGALRPNQVIEESPILLAIDAPDNLVSDGKRILFSTGPAVLAIKTDGVAATTELFATFDRPVTALALHPGGAVAIGLDDGRVVVHGGVHGGKTLTEAGNRRLVCPTALRFADESTLMIALGSQQNAPTQWKRDLMQRNASGSVWLVELAGGQATCLADQMAYPYGLLLESDGGVVVSESWRNRLVRIRPGGNSEVLFGDITGYPARLAPALDGQGRWLAVFAPRSQLIEFVLREKRYRSQMMAEIEPQFWIAPSLTAAKSILEPMQGGGLKQLGILKPWAPTRSYGLLVRLDGEYGPQQSFHSRADGIRHGITSSIEITGRLLATSKGGDAIVSIPLAAEA